MLDPISAVAIPVIAWQISKLKKPKIEIQKKIEIQASTLKDLDFETIDLAEWEIVEPDEPVMTISQVEEPDNCIWLTE